MKKLSGEGERQKLEKSKANRRRRHRSGDKATTLLTSSAQNISETSSRIEI